MTAIDARAYLEKSIDNVEDLPDDLAWTNAEVLEMLTEVVGLFEQAHTPTDDEREAIIDALLDELGWEWDEVPEEHIPSSRAILGDMADRVLAVSAGFRRPVQGEPTDAQVLAALNAEGKSTHVARRPFNPAPDLSYYAIEHVEAMRAALRAAFQTGENR